MGIPIPFEATNFLLSARPGEPPFMAAQDGGLAAVSLVAEGRLRYNNALTRWEHSENGGPWLPFAGGPLVIPLVARPWAAGADHQLQADAYTGVCFMYSAADAEWVPFMHTTQAFTLYVDPVAGNDAASGAFATPVKHLQVAINRIPPRIKHQVTIRFIDGGTSKLIDEQIAIENYALEPGGNLTILGNTALAVLPAGPNVVPANPANVGDYWSLTVAGGPGWIPGSLAGLRANFTAGPRTGTTCMIVDNTANTIIFGHRGGVFVDGPYGPTDGFNIEANLETIQAFLGFFSPTMTMANILGAFDPATFDFRAMQFVNLNITGDGAIFWAILFSGTCHVTFTECVIGDWVASLLSGFVSLQFVRSLAWTFQSGVASYPWCASFGLPEATWDLRFNDTGIRGALNIGRSSRGDFSRCNIMQDPLASVGTVLSYYGNSLSLSECGVDGLGSARTISLNPGAYGLIAINASQIQSSTDSGIGPQDANNEIGNIVIVIDKGFAPVPSDFAGNSAYGIDGTGLKIHIWDEIQSSVPNGIAGLRLRKGGFLMVLGNTPTCSGPLGPGLDDIDFDDRSPAWMTLWSDRATGLETLCHQQNNAPS